MKRARVAGWVLGLVTVFGVVAATYDLALAQAVDENGEAVPAEKKDEGSGSALKTFGSYALVLVGVGMVGAAVVKTFSSNMSYPQARLMFVNLLRTNPYQAEIVAKRMEGTFVEALGSALKTGATAMSQDPAVVASATAPTYDALSQGVLAKWTGTIAKAKLGVMAAIAGAAIGLSGGRILPVIIAVAAAAGFARLFLFKQTLESNLVRARREVLPEVDAAIVSGRYVAPVKPG